MQWCCSVEEVVADEYGIEMTVKSRKPAPLTMYAKNDVFVPPVLAKWLRPHQREGVQFMYECVMGLKQFEGNGCILADDMGLVSGHLRIATILTGSTFPPSTPFSSTLCSFVPITHRARHCSPSH